MKKSRIDIKSTIAGVLQIVLTSVHIIVLGVIFSHLTDYKANDHNNLIKVIVWTINSFLSWTIATSILKIFFRKKILFFNTKYILGAIGFSVLIVYLVGGEKDDYTYVSTFVTIAAIVATFSGIKIIKKKKGRPKKTIEKLDESSEN